MRDDDPERRVPTYLMNLCGTNLQGRITDTDGCCQLLWLCSLVLTSALVHGHIMQAHLCRRNVGSHLMPKSTDY